MLVVLMKCAKFKLLVSSFFCIAIHFLKSAFTFPSLQSSSLLERCTLLMVFEALFEEFCSSRFGSNSKIIKAVILDGLSDNQQLISFVSSSTNSLPALFDGRKKRIFP